MVRLQCNRMHRRYTIYLSSRTYRRKTVEGLKELVETLIYYRKNGTIIRRIEFKRIQRRSGKRVFNEMKGAAVIARRQNKRTGRRCTG